MSLSVAFRISDPVGKGPKKAEKFVLLSEKGGSEDQKDKPLPRV